MEEWPVNRAVGNVKNDEPELVMPVAGVEMIVGRAGIFMQRTAIACLLLGKVHEMEMIFVRTTESSTPSS